MARKVTVALEDDLDGSAADETVRFYFAGTDYEIDLSSANASAFREQLAPFIGRAGTTYRGRRGRTAANRQRSSQIRAWAKDQGIAVSDRGRMPASVADRYRNATLGR